MDTDAYVAAVEREGAALVAAAEGTPLDRRVPSCPDWSMADLLRHCAVLVRFWAANVRGGSTEMPDFTTLPTPPADDELVAWTREGVVGLVETLRATDPGAPAWNWAQQPPEARFWFRRMAHELAVHRWDAELGAGMAPAPVEPTLAADGIAEGLDTFLPRVLAGNAEASLGGTLHLHCTDTAGEWVVAVDHGEADVTEGHAKADVAVRGPASDILLFLWGRTTATPPEVLGDTEVLDRWRTLMVAP